MARSDTKTNLRKYLQDGRDAVVWKVDGLSEYDLRRPLTPTGTTLLGLVKHLAGCEVGYFGEVFGRPMSDPPPWTELEVLEQMPMVDMYATADESRDYILGWYRRSWAHSDETIEALDLDAIGRVPWWGERGEVDLHRILVHMTVETHRHAGQMDILRENIDGLAGLRPDSTNMPDFDDAWWADYRTRLEGIAAGAAGA